MDLDLSKRSKPCFKKNRMMSMGKVKNPFFKALWYWVVDSNMYFC